MDTRRIPDISERSRGPQRAATIFCTFLPTLDAPHTPQPAASDIGGETTRISSEIGGKTADIGGKTTRIFGIRAILEVFLVVIRGNYELWSTSSRLYYSYCRLYTDMDTAMSHFALTHTSYKLHRSR